MSAEELPEDLRDLAALLDEMGEAEREILEQALAPGEEAAEPRASEGLRRWEESLGPTDRPQRAGPRRSGADPDAAVGGRRGRRLLWMLLPVAAAAGVFWLFLQAPRSTVTDGGGTRVELLSGSGITLLEEGLAAGEFLRWDLRGSEGLVFDVRLADPAAGRGSAPLFRARVSSPEVQLPRDRSVPWPDSILLEIDALDGGGRLVDSFAARLSSSS